MHYYYHNFTFLAEKRAANDPELADGPNYNFLSDPEKYANGVRKAGLLAKKLKEYKLEDFNDAFSLRRYNYAEAFLAET